jgi:uncharacterized membrane protein YkvA (DUF1232 family)
MRLKQLKKQNFITAFLKKNWLIILAFIYFLSPIDIIPDVLPAIGFGDDIGVLLLSLLVEIVKKRYFSKKKTGKDKPKEILVEGEIIE